MKLGKVILAAYGILGLIASKPLEWIPGRQTQFSRMSMWHGLLGAPVADTTWGVTPPSLGSNRTFLHLYFLALTLVFGCWKRSSDTTQSWWQCSLKKDQADDLEQIPLVCHSPSPRDAFIANIGLTIQITVHTSYRCEIDRKTSVLLLKRTN